MIRTALPLALALSLAAGGALSDSHETAETEGAAGADTGAGTEAAGAAGTPGEAGAEMEGMDHSAMAEGDPAAAPMVSYMAVMETAMNLMPLDSTGDADADFLLMMIPHHQSAIDMARIVIEVGDDPEVQALAQRVIEEQEAEIAEMQEMLAAMGHPAPEPVDPPSAAEVPAAAEGAPAEEEPASE